MYYYRQDGSYSISGQCSRFNTPYLWQIDQLSFSLVEGEFLGLTFSFSKIFEHGLLRRALGALEYGRHELL